MYKAEFQETNPNRDFEDNFPITFTVLTNNKETIYKILIQLFPLYEGCVYRLSCNDNILISGVFDPTDFEED